MRPLVLLLACAGLAMHAPAPLAQPSTSLPCESAKESGLPLPSGIPPERLADYEKQLLAFLQAGAYVSLGWCGDKGVRDTGPWISDTYYGTHKAARIYYSPAVIRWLTGGRTGAIPDGAMIIKEQFTPPAIRYTEAPAPQQVSDWTVMIKDANGSRDGWFWGELWTQPSLMPFDDHAYPFNYPAAGFGLYCTRCHGSAEKESTFASLSNIKGAPGDPLTFRVDDTWRVASAAALRRARSHAPAPQEAPPPAPVVAPDPTFLQTFRTLGPVAASEVTRLPNETWDLLVAPAGAPAPFLTSNQCQGCHSAALSPFGPTMYLPTKEGNGVNVSPYTEWRWSPMGLAGRDPIFFAQLDSELAYVDEVRNETTRRDLKHAIVNLCFRCHGAMGKRQHDLDHPGTNFALENIMRTGSEPGAKYGALARDGVSCTACHHIAPETPPPDWKKSPLEYFLTRAATGLFATGPADQLFGPFRDNEIVTTPMNNIVGARPAYNEYVKSARLCGSCHTINLPVIDTPPIRPIGPSTPHSIEQATYLEWLNSQYQNELGTPGPKAQTCQGCHMPRGYTNTGRGLNVSQIQTRIAIVEDDTYPAAEHRAPPEEIRVRFRREGFVRHELLGLNAFLLEMFRQFNDVLGVRKSDYMTGTSDNLEDAQSNMFEQARTRTATVQASATVTGRTLAATVTVTNLAGHRFPSGVGFRRAWIELLAIETVDERNRLVWSSGRTNSVGVIVDAQGRPLPSEFFSDKAGGGRAEQHYQPHYETITSGDQVQIYEELTRDARGRFTTSFLRRDHEVKDNRLLPAGWSAKGPDPSLNGVFLDATFPKGDAAKDPDYGSGRGIDTVTYRIDLPADVDPSRVSIRATLYYQSIPPYYLNDRFTASKGDATRRLYYLASNLNLSDTQMEGWKIAIASASVAAPRAAGLVGILH